MTTPQVPDLVRLAPTVAEVNLNNLRHNARVLKGQVGSAGIIAVVKADAYGHGAEQVVRTLMEEGVDHFAVANVPEAVRLREAGIAARLLVFGGPLPDHIPYYLEHDLDLIIPSASFAEQLLATADAGHSLRVHLKVDTGMSRLGVGVGEAPDLLRRLHAHPGITVAGLWSHFATADDDREAFAPVQLAAFRALVQEAGNLCLSFHISNSAGIFALPEALKELPTVFVRPGLALYGVPPVPAAQRLRPVMRLLSHITNLKVVEAGTGVSYGHTWHAPERRLIATVGVGYADGYFRALSNKAVVGIRGRLYPVVGTICMDMCMVDLGSPDEVLEGLDVGEDVVLFGEGGPAVGDVAKWAETIPYEVLCAVSPRVPRIYLDADGISGVYDPAE